MILKALLEFFFPSVLSLGTLRLNGNGSMLSHRPFASCSFRITHYMYLSQRNPAEYSVWNGQSKILSFCAEYCSFCSKLDHTELQHGEAYLFNPRITVSLWEHTFPPRPHTTAGLRVSVTPGGLLPSTLQSVQTTHIHADRSTETKQLMLGTVIYFSTNINQYWVIGTQLLLQTDIRQSIKCEPTFLFFFKPGKGSAPKKNSAKRLLNGNGDALNTLFWWRKCCNYGSWEGHS